MSDLQGMVPAIPWGALYHVESDEDVACGLWRVVAWDTAYVMVLHDGHPLVHEIRQRNPHDDAKPERLDAYAQTVVAVAERLRIDPNAARLDPLTEKRRDGVEWHRVLGLWLDAELVGCALALGGDHPVVCGTVTGGVELLYHADTPTVVLCGQHWAMLVAPRDPRAGWPVPPEDRR